MAGWLELVRFDPTRWQKQQMLTRLETAQTCRGWTNASPTTHGEGWRPRAAHHRQPVVLPNREKLLIYIKKVVGA